MRDIRPEPRIFPSVEAYESTEELRKNRELLLTVIGKVSDVMNELGGRDQVVKESQLAELMELGKQLSAINATKEYLAQFTGLDGRFTRKARSNPEIMIRWITYDLLRIIQKLPKVMTVSGAVAQMGEFTDTQQVDDNVAMGILGPGQVTHKPAEFLGTQQALSFYLRVLDAESH